VYIPERSDGQGGAQMVWAQMVGAQMVRVCDSGDLPNAGLRFGWPI
jgi:hypothetical protein